MKYNQSICRQATCAPTSGHYTVKARTALSLSLAAPLHFYEPMVYMSLSYKTSRHTIANGECCRSATMYLSRAKSA
jgi:hypothetical protein